MKGKTEVIDHLNGILSAILTAINQYFIHSQMCENWGYGILDRKFRRESIRVMVTAESLIKRILYLQGQPNMSDYLKIRIGSTPVKQLKNDLTLELEIIQRLKKGIIQSREFRDDGTRRLLMNYVSEAEQNVDWLEAQIDQIGTLGEGKYLAQNIHKKSH
ncbi:MAG: bacterioferritin [bacterium]|nr:MAG: bacterioferritin [bacterium]